MAIISFSSEILANVLITAPIKANGIVANIIYGKAYKKSVAKSIKFKLTLEDKFDILIKYVNAIIIKNGKKRVKKLLKKLLSKNSFTLTIHKSL